MCGTSNIYLIRHGDRYNWLDPDWSKKVVMCGGLSNDSPLSPIGHEMARDTALKLKDVKADSILSSPYLRAIQTAVPFSEQKHLPIFIEHGLSEVHHIPELLPDARKRFIYFPHIDTDYNSLHTPVASGTEIDSIYDKPKETFPDEYFRRIIKFSTILDEHVSVGKTVICVSHAASVALVAALLKCDLENIPGDSNCDTNERTDMFAPVGVYHLQKEGKGEPWKLISNGSTNKHVVRTDQTTSKWGFGEDARNIWKTQFKPTSISAINSVL